jgi:hypothetical protein
MTILTHTNNMKIRIENIECRFSQNQYEFVKWYPNKYFGTKAQLIAEGYELIVSQDDDFSLVKHNHHIHGSCFQFPESCYVIATIVYDKNEHCTEIKSVGNRLLGLTKKERNYFFEVYQYADKQIKKENKNKDND